MFIAAEIYAHLMTAALLLFMQVFLISDMSRSSNSLRYRVKRDLIQYLQQKLPADPNIVLCCYPMEIFMVVVVTSLVSWVLARSCPNLLNLLEFVCVSKC